MSSLDKGGMQPAGKQIVSKWKTEGDLGIQISPYLDILETALK